MTLAVRRAIILVRPRALTLATRLTLVLISANERTYLAWLRTSLSVTAIGIAIEQLIVTGAAVVVGYLFVILGMLFLGVATFRYFRIMHLLQQVRSLYLFVLRPLLTQGSVQV